MSLEKDNEMKYSETKTMKQKGFCSTHEANVRLFSLWGKGKKKARSETSGSYYSEYIILPVENLLENLKQGVVSNRMKRRHHFLY